MLFRSLLGGLTGWVLLGTVWAADCPPPAVAQTLAAEDPGRWPSLYAQCWAELQYLRNAAVHPAATPRFWPPLPPPGLIPAY